MKIYEKYLKLKEKDSSKLYLFRCGKFYIFVDEDCGYIIYETHIKVRKRTIKKTNKRIKKWNKEYLNDSLDYNEFLLSFNSFKSHIKHANTYNLYNTYIDKIEFKEYIQDLD